MDWGSPITDSDGDSEIHIPCTQHLDESSYDVLKEVINPLESCSDYGINLYNSSVQFVASLL